MVRTGIVLALAAAAASVAVAGRPPTNPPPHSCGLVLGSAPAWSPDGQSVAFAREGIWTMSPDGSGQRLLNGALGPSVNHPSWSPNGREIAFDTGSGGQVYVMNADGSNLRLVASGGNPSFAPDGRHLALTALQQHNTLTTLDIVAVDGSERRSVAGDAAPDAGSPTWSPDGSTIAYTQLTLPGTYGERYPRLALVGADGSARPYTGIYADARDPRWSPNGDWIVYTELVRAQQPGGGFIGLSILRRIRPDGSERTVLADNLAYDKKGRPRGGNDAEASWSPDGKHVIFASRFPLKNFDTGMGIVDVNRLGKHRLGRGCTFGTGGSDNIAGTDGPDYIYALEGDDYIDVHGGGKDEVHCGRGRDRVRADTIDVVAHDCERVVRVLRRR